MEDPETYVVAGDYTLTAAGQRELERPPWPYCPECRHAWDEHDDGRCHEPGCKCGMNPW